MKIFSCNLLVILRFHTRWTYKIFITFSSYWVAAPSAQPTSSHDWLFNLHLLCDCLPLIWKINDSFYLDSPHLCVLWRWVLFQVQSSHVTSLLNASVLCCPAHQDHRSCCSGGLFHTTELASRPPTAKTHTHAHTVELSEKNVSGEDTHLSFKL